MPRTRKRGVATRGGNPATLRRAVGPSVRFKPGDLGRLLLLALVVACVFQTQSFYREKADAAAAAAKKQGSSNVGLLDPTPPQPLGMIELTPAERPVTPNVRGANPLLAQQRNSELESAMSQLESSLANIAGGGESQSSPQQAHQEDNCR